MNAQQEKFMRLSDLARALPREMRRGKNQLRAWCRIGQRVDTAADAPRVKLEHRIIGGVYHSSIEAVYRMIEASDRERERYLDDKARRENKQRRIRRAQ